jgi:hypothetical protein
MAGAGYLQARVQARFAQLPDEPLWRELEGAGDLPGYLRAANDSVLSPWVRGISPRSTSDEIEGALLRVLAETLEESAPWCDEAWQPAVLGIREWLGCLADPEQCGPMLEEWRQSLPAARYGEPPLAALGELLSAHWQVFIHTPPRQTDKARQQLDGELRRLFRRSICQPSVIFVWLALVAVQLERLRGGLLMRALYHEGDLPFEEAA